MSGKQRGSRHEQRQDASDAGLAVLDYQFRTHQPLQADERESVFTYDASVACERARDPLVWAPLLQRLSLPRD